MPYSFTGGCRLVFRIDEREKKKYLEKVFFIFILYQYRKKKVQCVRISPPFPPLPFVSFPFPSLLFHHRSSKHYAPLLQVQDREKARKILLTIFRATLGEYDTMIADLVGETTDSGPSRRGTPRRTPKSPRIRAPEASSAWSSRPR